MPLPSVEALGLAGDLELEFAQGGLVGTGFEVVGVSVATFDIALVRVGSDVADSLEEHDSVHEQFANFRDDVLEAVFKKDVNEVRVVVTFVVSVHG
jgi:hypothetical protein